MAPPKYRVQCMTWNGHLGKGSSSSSPDLSSWVTPTLNATSSSGASTHSTESGDPPDVIAVGFQEMIPLHLSLSGLTSTALNKHDKQLKAAIDARAGEKGGYTLMGKKVLGGIALLVYTRDATLTDKVVDIRVATAGCGIFNLMGNKGAVGVRITLDEEDADQDESTGNTVLTFVTAHLAAHDHRIERRNRDWKEIVRRLVFSDDGASDDFKPRRKRDIFNQVARQASVGSASGIQIYDTSYLFVFGDLNYRISTKKPKNLAPHVIAHKISNDLPSLLEHDQLTHEKSANRTLHHLREGAIEFIPTYKYKVGTVSEFKAFKKRIPGWCDRVLFATWADGEEGAGTIVKKVRGPDGEEKERTAKRKGAKVEVYTSVMSFTKSDHKPVTALISLPRAPKESRNLRLPYSSPYPIDPLWRRKQLIGWVFNRFVGFFWCIIMLAGLGKDARLGITTLTSAAIAAWWLHTA